MCFGNMATTGQTTTSQSYTPASWLTNAAQNNVNYATNLQSTGFQPYTGQQVANFSPQQSQSFGMGNGIAGAVTPELQLVGGALNNYTTAGPQSVTPETISSQMSPYMNQYVNLALQPQLAAAANSYQQQNQAMQGAATSAGAFGDPRANILQSNLGLNYGLENAGLVGNAYNAAFNTAIGAGAQDVSNNLNAQTTNANLNETALNRNLTGANAILGANTGATNLENTLGAQQTAQSQAQLNAMYNQWLMAQQYPFQTTQLVNSTIASGVPASPSTMNGTSTTQAPNNAGYAMLGSLLGSAGSAFVGGLPGGSGMGGSGSPMQFTPATGPGSYGNGNSYPIFYAEGGEPEVGKPAIVGEKGPEVFVPHEAGTVVPYERLKEAMDKKKSVSTKGLPKNSFGLAA